VTFKTLMNRQHQVGQALLEMVIVIPILLFLLLGAVQIILLFHFKLALDHACFQGARLAIVSAHERGFQTEVEREMRRYLPETLGFALNIVENPGDLKVGHGLTLNVSLHAPSIFPLITRFFSKDRFLLKSTCTLSSEVGPYVSLD